MSWSVINANIHSNRFERKQQTYIWRKFSYFWQTVPNSYLIIILFFFGNSLFLRLAFRSTNSYVLPRNLNKFSTKCYFAFLLSNEWQTCVCTTKIIFIFNVNKIKVKWKFLLNDIHDSRCVHVCVYARLIWLVQTVVIHIRVKWCPNSGDSIPILLYDQIVFDMHTTFSIKTYFRRLNYNR